MPARSRLGDLVARAGAHVGDRELPCRDVLEKLQRVGERLVAVGVQDEHLGIEAPRGRTRGASLPIRGATSQCSARSANLLQPLPVLAVDVDDAGVGRLGAVRSGRRRRPRWKLVAARTAARCSAARRDEHARHRRFRVARRIALSTPTMIEIPSPSEIAWLSRRFVMSSESRPASSPFGAFPSHIRARGRTTIASGRRRGQPDLDTRAAQTPIGCQTVFSSRNAAISYGLCRSARPRTTRLTLSAARRSKLQDLSVGAGDVDRVHVHMTGEPRRELRLEPGEDVHHCRTSEVASASASSIAAGARSPTPARPPCSRDDHRCQRPRAVQRRLVRRNDPDHAVGSGIVKLKYGAATGFEVPRTCAYLSAHPAYQTQRSTALSTSLRPELARRAPPSVTPSSRRCDRAPARGCRPSSRATFRRRRGQPAPRRERPSATRARSGPGPRTCARLRRGKSPPTKSLYVLRTGSRVTREPPTPRGRGTARARGSHLRGRIRLAL